MKRKERVLILADLEGIYGVYDLSDMNYCKCAYCEEISIYLETLVKEEIEHITLCDIHDQGNLLFDLRRRYEGIDLEIVSTVENINPNTKYDFALLVGFHGMVGSFGILPHTLRYNFTNVAVYSEKWKSKVSIGEVGIYSRWLAGKGIPVILASGDREAVYEANQFNPYRATCCVKSIFEREEVSKELLRYRIEQAIIAALQLDYNKCFETDDEKVYITFINKDFTNKLTDLGFRREDEFITYDNCFTFINEVYRIADLLIEFDKTIFSVNVDFLNQIKRTITSMGRQVFDESEVGKMLAGQTIYTMDATVRTNVLEQLRKNTDL